VRVASPENNEMASTNATTYRQLRRAYYNRFPSFWGTFSGEKIEEYAVFGALVISNEHAQSLRQATTRLYQLMTRLASSIQHADDQTLIDIGIPLGAIPYARLVIPDMPAIMCGRFEFALTEAGPRLLEFNAETPTFVVESFQINSQVCADFGLEDPNAHCQEQLTQAIHSSINAGIAWVNLPSNTTKSVVFSSYAQNKEERETVEYYRNIFNSMSNVPYIASYHSLEELSVRPDALITSNGDRVDVLYKLYPTEHLIKDEDRDGTPVGLLLLDLVRKQRLAIINPSVAFILQNKALMATLWALHIAHSKLFTSKEHTWIERYMLPTYLEPFDENNQPLFTDSYVIKPVYGREGISIAIRNIHDVIEESPLHFYNNQVMVYQQYAPLPATTIQTENGPTKVHLVHSCFVVNGKASAIGVRASQQRILDDAAYFLPVCLDTKSKA
jgi:glutathionylspermidine synthase